MSKFVPNPQAADRLHIPHQMRGDESGNHYALSIPFSNSTFGSAANIELPSVPMVPDDGYISFSQATIATITSPGLVQTPFYINENGIQLSYAGQAVYTMTSEECYVYGLLNARNQGQVLRHLNVVNEGNDPIAAGVAQKNAVAGAGVNRLIPLRPIVDKWLAHYPLSAFPHGKWTISVPWVPSLAYVATGAASTAGTGGAISNGELLLSGHSESSENAGRVAAALAGAQGVEFVFLQPNQKHLVYSSETSLQLLLNSLQGDLDHIVLMDRNNTGRTSTTPDTICRTQWVYHRLASDTISVGTSSNPTYLYGRSLPLEQVRVGVQGNVGSAYGVSYMSRGDPAAATKGDSPKMIDMAIYVLNASENPTMSQEHGTYSGTIRVFNDFQINMNVASSSGILTAISYLRKKAVITYGGLTISDE